MITTVFNAVATDPTPLVVDAYDNDKDITLVQSAVTGDPLTAGSLTVEGSLDNVHWFAISGLAFTYGNMNNNLVKSVTNVYPFLRFTLGSLAFNTVGTVTVTVAR